jgi:dTDP-4-dehydrorhamnose 3,5-epimerase
MRLVDTALPGAFVLELEPVEDERGFFARALDGEMLRARGLVGDFAQCSLSYNRRRGTLRGLHWQAAPHEETKIVRCVAGAVCDVLVDLRRDSPTYKRWIAIELDARNRRAVYIPRGVAHGFQTLSDDSELYYHITPAYRAEAARGLRWNDPAFAIAWPLAEPILSARDRSHPDFEEQP